MEKFGFFNSINNDRVYDAEDFALFFSKYFTNGVFSGGLSVSKNTGMSLSIKNGDANINGYRYTNDDSMSITLNIGDAQYTRIDNICVRLDLDNRKIGIVVDEGIPSSSPVAKSPQRTSLLYDLIIAQVTIPSGTTELTEAMIKDTRFDNSICGIVTGAVDQIDTTNVYKQYEYQFNEWFTNLKIQLDGDIAGNLQNQINDIKDLLIFDTEVIEVEEEE